MFLMFSYYQLLLNQYFIIEYKFNLSYLIDIFQIIIYFYNNYYYKAFFQATFLYNSFYYKNFFQI